MLDIVELQKETEVEMLKFFKEYDLANFMEVPDSQANDLPACYLTPLATDPTGQLYDGSSEQAKSEVIGLLIVAKVGDLAAAKKHIVKVFSGYQPHPRETSIPFQPMLYNGGELKSIKSNTYAWMEMYKTYTLGGC